MSLLSHFAVHRGGGRLPPVAGEWVRVTGHADRRAVPSSASPGATQHLVAYACLLANGLIVDGSTDDDGLARLEAALDEFVEVWTPSVHTRSRFEFVSLLAGSDDAIREITVSTGDASVGGSSVLLEWSATGRFAGPLFLDDDRLVEPTGGVIEVAGGFVAAFDGERAVGLRLYYDQLTLLAQMGVHPAGARSTGRDR